MISKFREENVGKYKRHFTKYYVETQSFSRGNNKFNKSLVGGTPILYDHDSKTVFVDSDDTHTIVYGATGSLKTRAIVMPTIKILGKAGESMIINDSKGELHNRLAAELYREGYEIITINLRKPEVGNSWNPLAIPNEFYCAGDMDKAAEFANDIATNLMLNERSSDDPFWDYSSSDLLFGLILGLFKYCKDHGKGKESVNILNLMKLRRVLFSKGTMAQNSQLWKYLSDDELIEASISGTVYAPKDTMNSILSVFDQHMRTFTIQPTLMEMLSNNDFNVGDIGIKKTAVFLITPDEKTSYHKLVSLFVKQSYEYLIYCASLNSNNSVENRITFVLDEFSSLPTISDMPAMISAARSRKIRFLLVVQSKSSLRKKYAEEAETIISNCSNIVFFTSRELELLRELSELCGKQKNGEANISVYDLQHLSKDRREALVLCGRMDPAVVEMIDIDLFGDRKYEVLEFAQGLRTKREVLEFELSPELKEKYPAAFQPPKIPSLLSTDKPDEKKSDKDFEEILRIVDQEIEKLPDLKIDVTGGADDGN